MKNLVATPLAICLLLASTAHGQSLKDSPQVFESGNWSVVRSVDAMTDKVSCTGLYKKSPDVQLSSTGLYIVVPGGIQSVKLRFDDEPALEMRLPTEMEKKVRAIILDGSFHQRVIASARLRYESLTAVRGLASGNLDLTGIQEAAANIASGCPPKQ